MFRQTLYSVGVACAPPAPGGGDIISYKQKGGRGKSIAWLLYASGGPKETVGMVLWVHLGCGQKKCGRKRWCSQQMQGTQGLEVHLKAEPHEVKALELGSSKY